VRRVPRPAAGGLGYPLLPAHEDDRQAPDGEVAEARRLGGEFARAWVKRVPEDEVRTVLAAFPTLPQPLDIELLLAAEQQLGSLRGRPDLKSELRGTFWFALKEEASAT
jgi:hypothetical protein